MNRLVIIGNGFDMAHGLKTSYMEKTCRVDVFRVSEFRVGARYLPFSCHQS